MANNLKFEWGAWVLVLKVADAVHDDCDEKVVRRIVREPARPGLTGRIVGVAYRQEGTREGSTGYDEYGGYENERYLHVDRTVRLYRLATSWRGAEILAHEDDLVVLGRLHPTLPYQGAFQYDDEARNELKEFYRKNPYPRDERGRFVKQ